MKKVLMVLGVIFLLAVGGVVGLLVWAHQGGQAIQESFFRAVEAGNSQAVIEMMHPALAAEVDEPVLAAWMSAFRRELGAFKGLDRTDFNTSSNYTGGGRVVESSGMVLFERGQARSELRLVDDKLVAFEVTSDRLPDGWFTGPASTELYQQRGQQFLERALGGQVQEAFDLMDGDLQRALPLERLQQMMTRVGSNAGPLRSVQYVSHDMAGTPPVLKVYYAVVCENDATRGRVEFQFTGMKGRLMAFDLTGD